MVGFDPNATERRFDQVEEHADAFRSMLNRVIPDRTLDVAPLNDAEFAAWFELQVRRWPAEQMVLPDGERVFASPFVVMLDLKRPDGTPLVDGGIQFLERYERVRGLSRDAERSDPDAGGDSAEG